jgi:hypothetical protein
MRRAASSAALRTWRSVRLSLRLARELSLLLFLALLPERLDVWSPEVEPRLLRAGLPPLSVAVVSSPVVSVEVVSVLEFSCVVAVFELLSLLLLAFFLEQPMAASIVTTAMAMMQNLLFIFDRSPYDCGLCWGVAKDSSFGDRQARKNCPGPKDSKMANHYYAMCLRKSSVR